MKIQKLTLEDIHYVYTAYDPALKESLQRIALSFPIKVLLENNKYKCVDGHKRLSAIHDILATDKQQTRFHKIPAIVMNNARTANGWSIMNHH